ncbi:hypothetical protein R4Y45_06100 [Holzapfeliella sp. He02]|uniref:Capsid protein n=1 Tax=Holzapfeliella saturejae TaxID=3082953 RepID=A0ABU8SHD8_9LACO
MAEQKLTTTQQLQLKSVDFTNQFNQNLSTLLKVLGITRKTNLPVGNAIKIYKTSVDKTDGKVGEGEIIPLSQVKKEVDDTKTLEYSKYRKSVSIEGIQGAGFQQAVTETDLALLREVQRDIKNDLIDQVKAGSGQAQGDNFQKTVANALAKLSIAFDDTNATDSVLFVNPIDFYGYLGDTPIQMQSAFGLNYIQNYLGFTAIIMNPAVEEGKIYATPGQNLNMYYANASSAGFEAYTDETGYISIMRNQANDRLTLDTTMYTALKIFPERLDGVIAGTIGKKAANTK